MVLVEPLGPSGVLRLSPQAFGDERGYFLEGWHREKYRDAGIDFDFVQWNISKSVRGVIRGLHYQEPMPQGKLVGCLVGAIWDVAVDIRSGSPTFGQWWAAELSEENHSQLWIPPGFAHGFEVRSDSATVAYLVTAVYRAEFDRSICWNDPDIAVEWQSNDPRLSPKDATAPRLCDAVLPVFQA